MVEVDACSAKPQLSQQRNALEGMTLLFVHEVRVFTTQHAYSRF